MADPAPISFARGAPSYDIVDVEGLREATRRAAEGKLAWATPYGGAAGFPPLREWLAAKHGVDPARVLVTNGSMQADAFLFDELAGPGVDVVVERPTYDRTLLGLRERGATLHAIGLEDDGLDVAELQARLDGGLEPAFAHILPTFHNPAGCTLSLAKRRELVGLADARGFLIFEDDPYIDIRFSGEPLPRMLDLDETGVVIYASSFSKTVCPGIRVGYLIAPDEDLATRLAARAMNTYISPGMLAQAVVHEFCASGEIDRSIATVKSALGERVDVLSAALRSQLPEASFVQPEGGYFLWIELPEGTDSRTVAAAAKDRGVIVTAGTEFIVDGGERALRIAYSGVDAGEIDEGVRRLADAWRSTQA
ncbi:MAG: PLP-dependent aminotransferase family protein [Solirubrobacteraceae bacterium]